MELHQLRYFVAVAQTKSFSRAAERCHVAQPSLSQQIMKLEGDLEERLFERNKRSVSLTPAGELLLAHAERVLDNVQVARDSVRDARAIVRGRVSLGVLPTVAPYYLPRELAGFSAEFPGVEVTIHEDTTAQLCAAVFSREVDVALVSLPVERSGLVVVPLFEEKLMVTVPPGHALARRKQVRLEDLAKETFILMKEGHCLTGQTLQFCRLKGFAPRVNFRSAQIETIISFVKAGFGISVVPEMAALPNEGVRYLDSPGLRRKIGLLRQASRPPTPAVRALVKYLEGRAAVSG